MDETRFERLRYERYDRIYLSPHMDDVAYSCSGRILQERAEGLRVLVVTIFGSGKPLTGDSGSSKRFGNYEERFAEELAAMEALDADLIWLNEPELLFRKKAASTLVRYFVPFLPASEPAVQGRLIAVVSAICQSLLDDHGELICPLGVGFHPDHRLVFEVGRALHVALPYPVRFYEDLPYGLADHLTQMRHRFLGDQEVQVSPYRASIETERQLLKSFGMKRWFVCGFIFSYLAVLLVVQRALGFYDRVSGQTLPQADEHEIADVIGKKADVMRLYASQTDLFFAAGPGLVEDLRRDGRFVERTWTFPSSDAEVNRKQMRALRTRPKGA